MPRKAPDQPIRLPSSRRLWQIGLWGLFAYIAVGVVVVTLDRGSPAALDERLEGCHATDGARACFTRNADTVSLRISEDGRDTELEMSAWTGRRAYTVPGYGGQSYLEVERVTTFNSFGRVVQTAELSRGDCRLVQMRPFEDGSQSARWQSNRDCWSAAIPVSGSLRRTRKSLVIDFDIGDRTFDLTLEPEDAAEPG